MKYSKVYIFLLKYNIKVIIFVRCRGFIEFLIFYIYLLDEEIEVFIGLKGICLDLIVSELRN